MELNAITPNLLDRTLRDWQQGKKIPAEILELHFLVDGTGGTSPAELSLKLYDFLLAITTNALKQYRHAHHVATSSLEPSSQNGKALLITDFSTEDVTLKAWSVLYHRYLAPVPMDNKDLAKAVGITVRQIQRYLTTGLDLLVDGLQRAERDAHLRVRQLHLQRHLPPTDHTPPIGIATYVEHLVQLFMPASDTRFVSIEGLGGIGKTVVAQAIAWHISHTEAFNDILWVRVHEEAFNDLGLTHNPTHVVDEVLANIATQLGLTQSAELSLAEKQEKLRPILTLNPYLVVIDNLETEAVTDALLPILHPLAAGTRFLLTSRHTLEKFTFVYRFAVPELSLINSQQLITSLLADRLQRAAVLDVASVQSIYETVGGVPLALKLIAAQLQRLPLAYILEGLRHARQEGPEMMFTRIYWRTWFLLDDDARAFLLSMLQVSSDGDSLAWIRQVSSLPDPHFEKALVQLLDYFLLEITGSYELPMYRLHRLTATFLQTDLLLDWHGEVDS